MTSRPAQVLEIDPPSEIVLKGPYTDIVTTHLKLTNPSGRVVAFKVKTTAPKQYCVRPNSGVIPANSSSNVAIMLQPFDVNSERDRSKHKFMVQSAYVPESSLRDKVPLDNMWKAFATDQLMDSKLRVVFDNTMETTLSSVGRGDPEFKPPTVAGLAGSVMQESDADNRRLQDDLKRLQHQLQTVEMENTTLREQLSTARRMERQSAGSAEKQEQLSTARRMERQSAGSTEKQEQLSTARRMERQSAGSTEKQVVPGGFSPVFVAAIAFMAILLGFIMHAFIF